MLERLKRDVGSANFNAQYQQTPLVQSGGLVGGDDDLDDAAIERSIAEINEAIRRSAAKRR